MRDRHSALHAYAGWNTGDNTRRCSSGGAAYLLGLYILRNQGVVYGTVIESGGKAAVARIISAEELERTKGSKYVRSSLSAEIMSSMEADLKDGKMILFVGTPCQVAGIRKRFGDGDGRLFLADLLCHGTPPQSYLDDELRYLAAKGRLSGSGPVTDIRFRSGSKKSDYHLSIWNQDNCQYSVEARKQPYVLAMLQGVTLMEGCYECPFAHPERAGDITLGDYIGLGAEDGFRADADKISYISVNTPAGILLYDRMLKAFPGFSSVERPVDERQAYRTSILEPAAKSPLRGKFLRLLPRLGFARAVRRTMRGEILRQSGLYRRLHHLAHRIKSVIS